MCYINALDLEKYWALHGPPTPAITFWQESSDTFRAVGAAIAVNMTTALVVGGLDIPVYWPREQSMHSWFNHLWDIAGDGHWLDWKQYQELMFVSGLYYIFTEEPLKVRTQLLRITTIFDEWPYKEDTVMPRLFAIVKALADEIDTMPMSITAAQLATIKEGLADLRKVAREIKVEPIKWAVHERVFPKGLAVLLAGSIPIVKLANGKRYVSEDVYFNMPQFCEPTEEQLDSSEEGVRYMM
jgi:hypothetical protein